MISGESEQSSQQPQEQGSGHVRHVAIIMDGNGRWARRQGKPRVAGHRAGVTVLRSIVEHCALRGIQALTVFAFSSENWQRPGREVNLLLELFMKSLRQEVRRLHENRIRLQFIGDQGGFPADLREAISAAESLTADNSGLVLAVAANYGGRWDILNAARQVALAVARGELNAADIDEHHLRAQIALGDLPEPDLFIRTGGEQRISNFLLWQLAYTELYFTDCLWPDFTPTALDEALSWFASRQRRFGRLDGQNTPAGDHA